jgi:Ion channel
VKPAVAVAGLALVLLVLWETFETLVLPRRVTRRLRITRVFYRGLWAGWSAIGRRHPGARRENYLSVFAPLSLLVLLALWVAGVIVGFALILWGLEVPLAATGASSFGTYLYVSATTFVTLGLGDVTPVAGGGRALIAIEAAAGFAFLALTISYLPVLYQAFSRREVNISMLDQWAGSPPSGVELLRRAAEHDAIGSVETLLADWERWSADLLESHLSYPVLAYFRSQHEHQSWLAALTSILDASALVISGVGDVSEWQARRTFAIARHAVVDLAQVFLVQPDQRDGGRVHDGDSATICAMLSGVGLRLDPAAAERFTTFRAMYEPYVLPLSRRLEMPLPALMPAEGAVIDDWQRSAWDETQ